MFQIESLKEDMCSAEQFPKDWLSDLKTLEIRTK